MKREVLHFKMEMKYLCSKSSETMVLATSLTLVQIRRSWHKYSNFVNSEAAKKWIWKFV